MDAGSMDQRLRFDRKVSTRDADYGTVGTGWTPYLTVWGSVQDLLPSKTESADQGIRIAERPTRIRIRYIAGITPDMRIVNLTRDNRVMKILSPPVEIGRRDGLEMLAADFSTAGETT